MATREPRDRAGRRKIPPYSSFLAFETFLRRAGGEGLPTQVDKTLLIEWGIAAGNESGLLTSVRALGLVDDDGRPTELYRDIRLSQPRRIAALRRAAELAYPGLTPTSEKIDEDQLYDYFVEQRGLTGQMVDKAIRFYRQLSDTLRLGEVPLDTETPRRGVSALRPVPSRPTTPALATSPAIVGPPRQALSLPITESATRATTDDVGLTIVVQVAPTASESELTDLFRRVRRAWQRSREVAET